MKIVHTVIWVVLLMTLSAGAFVLAPEQAPGTNGNAALVAIRYHPAPQLPETWGEYLASVATIPETWILATIGIVIAWLLIRRRMVVVEWLNKPRFIRHHHDGHDDGQHLLRPHLG